MRQEQTARPVPEVLDAGAGGPGQAALDGPPERRANPAAYPAERRSAFRITTVTEVPDRGALDALLLEYYGVIVAKLAAAGGPDGYTAADLMASFWPNLHRLLAPTGRLMLVQDAADRLVGCVTLHQVRADAGEVKRLYVRPEARGLGLARRLVAAQVEAARAMGWRTLLVNILKGNEESIGLFETSGFRYIDRYPECADPAEVDPWFVYMQRDLA